MFRYSHILFLTLCASLFWLGCSKQEAPLGFQGVSVKLSVGGPDVKSTQMQGEDIFNENLIENALCLLYPQNSDDQTEALCYFYVHGQSEVDPLASSYKYFVRFTSSGSFTFNPTQVQIDEEIFPAGATQCTLLVIANADFTSWCQNPSGGCSKPDMQGNPLTGSTTRGAMLSRRVTANFAQGSQQSFVMTGSNGVSISRNSIPYSGSWSVNLGRLASKVELEVSVPNNAIIVANEAWVPDYAHVQWSLMGLNNEASINGAISSGVKSISDRTGIGPRKYDSSSASLLPAYSYPWNVLTVFPNDLSAVSDDRGAYIRLVLPVENGGRIKYFHYKLRLLTSALSANNWYKQTVNISVAGSTSDDIEPVEIEGTLSVMPWSGVNNDVVIHDRRYLDILYGDVEVERNTEQYNTQFGLSEPQNVIILKNQNSVEVPIETSHRTIVKSVSIKSYDYSNTDYGSDYSVPRVGVLKEDDPSAVDISVSSNNILQISHQLLSRVSDDDLNFDASAYYIAVTLCHEDRQDVEQTICLVQYPAISISAQWTGMGLVESGTFVNGNNDGRIEGGLGWAGTTTDRNKNFNLIEVSINKLNAQSGYLIADPRADRWSESDLAELGSWSGSWAQRPDMEGTVRSLQHYRNVKTGEGSDFLIAPSFVIASSHAGVGRLTREQATRRCASYQEYGYPAGRWRIPTRAELDFLMGLTYAGKIERLLGGADGDNYFVNTGTWTIRMSGGNVTGVDYAPDRANQTAYVRCVYDTWYWKDKCPINQFTWGDMQ